MIGKLASVAAFAAAMSVASAQTADAPANRRIVVAPGYTLVVGDGWYACDPAVNAQIGAGTIPAVFAKMCADPPKDMTVPLIKPDLGGFEVVMVGVDATPAPPNLGGVDNAQLNALDKKICASEYLASSKFSRCELQIGTVAGRPGLTGTLLTPGDNGLAMKMRVAVVLDPGKPAVIILFARAALGTTPDKFGDDPDIEAMLASLAPQ